MCEMRKAAMKALLIPVKDLRNAKQRLAPELSQADRTALAEAMFDDFCASVAQIRCVDRVFVITNYDPAIERANSLGWEVLRETTQESESASVDAASRICAARGIMSLARVPIDLPLVTCVRYRANFRGGAAGAIRGDRSIAQRKGHERAVAHAAAAFPIAIRPV